LNVPCSSSETTCPTRDLEHIGAEELAREERGALWLEPGACLDLAARDQLEDERPLGHVGPDHPRHDEPVEQLDEPADELRVVRLLEEVELRAEIELELLGELLELHQPGRLRAAGREANRRAQQRKVELDLLDDSGASHLGDHLLPRGEQPAMRLRDRGGGERLRVETDEDLLAKVLPEHGLDLGERDRRDGVDEVAELLDVDVGQEVRPRRQELSELDERRAELLEAAAKRPRSLARRFGPADHADLGKDAPQSALVCDPPDGQSAPSALETCAHDGLMPPLATWETHRARSRACRFPGLEEAAAVAHPVDAVLAMEAEASEEVREERCDEQEVDKP
jgi:hypothetical protein